MECVMVKIKYNKDLTKPMQVEDINVEHLYKLAEYASPIFEYTINLLKKKFEENVGAKCNVRMGPLKSRDRVEEKLREPEVDNNPSNILDIVRATVTLNTLEDLLKFLKFVKNTKLCISDFEEDNLDKSILSDIKKRVRSSVIAEEVLKKEENAQYTPLSERKISLDVATRMLDFKKRIKVGLNNVDETPALKGAIRNSFSFNIDKNLRQEYPFLPIKSENKRSNYMDVKFYICVPISSFDDVKNKDNYMICEVIATLSCFDKVYDKTHALFEVVRDVQDLISEKNINNTFKPKYNGDIEPEILIEVLNCIARGIYVDDVIMEYNEKNKNSIQLLPHNDDKVWRDNILNNVGSSLTLMNALCGIKNYKR